MTLTKYKSVFHNLLIQWHFLLFPITNSYPPRQIFLIAIDIHPLRINSIDKIQNEIKEYVQN